MASLIVRLLPSAPFVVVNMSFGVARVSFGAFMSGMALGVLPKTALVAFAGNSITSALAGNLGSAAFMAAAALALWIMLAVLVRRMLDPKRKDPHLD